MSSGQISRDGAFFFPSSKLYLLLIIECRIFFIFFSERNEEKTRKRSDGTRD